MAVGALVGAGVVLGFIVIHGLWISDIWFNVGPMVFAGAACGLCIVWSYNSSVGEHTTRRWLAYNGSYVGLLMALGGASFLVLEPRFTMAEMMQADDALAQLIPPALPLMIAATLIGAVLLWVAFGRAPSAFAPILVTQAALVFLVGHNLAILGLVEMTSSLLNVFVEFIGLTLFLGAAFALATLLVYAAIGDRRI